MNCENVFCIYQSNGICNAEQISINPCGMCTECIYPDIDSKTLEEAKKALLEKYVTTDAVRTVTDKNA